jgi:hypothetical protein
MERKVLTAVLLASFLFIIAQGHAYASCTTYTYTVAPGFDFKGIIKFDYLDLNIRQGGIQDTLVVAPGQRVAAQVRWTFGTSCSNCMFYVNVYGSWRPKEEIARLYSGPIGTTPSVTLVPFFFKAPEAGGEHILRVIFTLGEGHASDYQASNILRSPCVENKYVFFLEGVLNVSQGEALEVEITSPKSKAGIIEKTLGETIDINASIKGNVSEVMLYIDGRNVSKALPYSWNTSNESEGVHVVAVEALGFANNTAREEIRVELLNKSAMGELPPLIWVKELGRGLSDLEFSGDGRLIFIGGKNYISLYNRDGSLIWRQSIKGNPRVSLSPNGKAMAIAIEKEIRYLSPSGGVIWNYTFPRDVSDLTLTPLGFVVAAAGREMYYIDSNGTLLWNRSLKDNINAIAAAGDGVAVAAKNRVYLFSNESTPVWTYPAPGLVSTLAATTMGAVAIGTGKDVLYLSSNGTLQWGFMADDPVTSVAISADGKYLAAASGKTLYFYEGTGLRWSQQTRNPIRKVLLSGDGSTLVSAAGNKVLLIQNFKAKKGLKVGMEALAVFAAIAAAALIAYARRRRRVVVKRPVEEKMKAGIELEAVSEGLQILREGSLLIDVVNSKTKRPVIRANVSLDGRVKETDEKGQVVFEDVSRGRYRIKVEREFYKTVEAEHEFRGPEEQLRMELTPVFGLRDAEVARLKKALGGIKKNYQVISHLDSCLPGYYKSIGENVVDFVETVSDLPGYFKAFNYEDVIENLISIADVVCRDLSEIMVDWRNIKLYEVGGKSGAGCKAKPLRGIAEFENAVTDPERFVEHSKPIIRQRLLAIDRKITERIGELTITPLSGLWGISEKLMRLADEKPAQRAVEWLRVAVLLIFADSLLDYVEDMLQNEEVMDRLRHGIL